MNQEKESYQENQALIKTVFTNRNLKTYYQTNYMEERRPAASLAWVPSDLQASEAHQVTLIRMQDQWAAPAADCQTSRVKEAECQDIQVYRKIQEE